ncbi:MAG: amidohydrolase [Clostridia bacterium]|nr:amidohydrolase [Clostridia bacterium]
MNEFDITAAVRARTEQMIAERRQFHTHPELSGEETETAMYVAAELRKMGMTVTEIPAGGVIGVLNGDRAAPALLLRADMDALPIQETPRHAVCERTCISQVPGKMHACGHDAHMAMLLCAARILSEQDLRVPLVFVFESGEENNTGFARLLPFLLAHFDIGACYATHVWPDIPSGTLALCRGAATSGGFGFEICLKGQGGHGARPDLAASPIDCFAALHTRLNGLRMTAAPPDQALTYSVGMVHAGNRPNVIPESLTFSGTVRTFDVDGVGERYRSVMFDTIRKTAESFDCQAEFLRAPKPVYETFNDEHWRERLLRAAGQLPAVRIADHAPWMASETLGFYFRLWPGVLSFTGVGNPEKGCTVGHHMPDFDLDEDGMPAGAAMAVLAALEWNREPEPVPEGYRRETLEQLLERRL